MKLHKYLLIGFFITAVLFAQDSKAELSAEADVSFWWVIYEENENGILQEVSKDKAAQSASGFYLNRARIILYPSLPEYKLFSKLQVQLEGDVQLLDAWLSYRPISLVNIYVGQMKVPSTYEVATNEFDLDFITRSAFSRNVVNYSLLKTPYESPFRGLNSHMRDLGIGIKGSWDAGQDRDVFRYFVMIGNGLGSNLNIGGSGNPGFMVGNKFGDYFYGIRAEALPFEWMTIGGHYNYNVHNNMLFNDKKTVYDIDRTSWSADCRLKLPWGFRATGMYGQGVIDDNWLRIDKKNYEYAGWEAKVFKEFFNDKLELGVRYDSYGYEINESGQTIDENDWTFGINYKPISFVRLQLNYMIKDTVHPYEKDLRDNVVFFNVEADIESSLNSVLVKR